MPYNVDNYRSDGLKMQYAEDYFNSGVLLLNLQKARQHITMSQVYELLTGHKYMFSDQDVLNMLFDGKVLPLDFSWNYTTFVAGHLQSGNIHSQTLYADLQRDKPAIIHYVGKRKPWSTGEILREQYEKYYNIMENKI